MNASPSHPLPLKSPSNAPKFPSPLTGEGKGGGGGRGQGRPDVGQIRGSLLVIPWIFLMLLLLPGTLFSAQITIDSDEQFRFAEQTMEKGEYLRAVVEFERLLQFFPEDKKVPKARLLIAQCYMKAKDYESARKVLNEVLNDSKGTLVAGKALFLMGESYYEQGLYDEAERYFKGVITAYPEPELRNSAVYRLGWIQMQTGKWLEASGTFKAVGVGSSLFPSAQDLSAKSLGGELLPYKDPTTAGALSVVPGLGHAYCERYKDGLVAFLLNGLFILATFEAFHEDQEVLGAVLGFIELGFYSGTIYSAVNSAHKYNRKLKDDFLLGLPDTVDLNVFATKEGHIGLALKFTF
jgi:outer membrane protein assembly factor BamD (BamD/ComL family)